MSSGSCFALMRHRFLWGRVFARLLQSSHYECSSLKESFVTVPVCLCDSSRNNGATAGLDTRPTRTHISPSKQRTFALISWKGLFYCGGLGLLSLTLCASMVAFMVLLIASVPRAWPCERLSEEVWVRVILLIKWLSGWAYHGSCRGTLLTCRVRSCVAASPEGLCVTTTALTPSALRLQHTSRERSPDLRRQQSHTYTQTHHWQSPASDSPGFMQRFKNQNRGDDRKEQEKKNADKVQNPFQEKLLAEDLQALSNLFIKYRWQRQPLPCRRHIS